MFFALCLFENPEKKLDNSFDLFCCLLSVEQVIAGLDRAAATMKKGEQAILTIHHDYGFGSTEVRRDRALIPPCSNVIYEVEMLDCIKVMINLT